MEHGQLQEWTDAIDQIDGLASAAYAQLFEFIVAFDRAEGWKVDGAPSMVAWLVVRRGLSSFTASEHVRVARALESLPKLKALFASGGLSLDQIRAVTKIATAETDGYWAHEAPHHGANTLARMARLAREKTTDEAVDDHRNRALRSRWDPDGNLRMVVQLPPDQGAVVEKALERRLDQVPRDAKRTEPLSALRADALVEIAGGSLAADPDPDRATVLIHVDARTNGTGIVALDQGPPISVETAQRLLCDARIQAVAYSANQPIALGRTSRTVPPHVSRVIRFRDGGACRVCGTTRNLVYHHLKLWSQGGPTNPDNIITICAPDHWRVHEGGWRIEGEATGKLRIYDQHGRPYEPAPRPLRPDIRERILGLPPPESPPSGPPPEEPPLADTS